MTFSEVELQYLAGQRLGRLATLRPDGTLQNSPVGFHHNATTGTIDITGYNMAASRKFKNVAATREVAFVVDDLLSVQPWRVRCLEIRGWAEAVDDPSGPIIRVHPRRIIGFGLDEPDVEPHRLRLNSRTVA